MKARAALCAAFLGASVATSFAAPQQPARQPDARKEDLKKDEAGPEEPLAQYEPPMLRLAETLGALTFLRVRGGGGGGRQGREGRGALPAAGGRGGPRRARLAGAFNRGFQDYALVYRVCTRNAELALARRIAEGQKLSRDLAARWGS